MRPIKRNLFLALSGGVLAASALPLPLRAAETDITLLTGTGTIFGTLSLPASNKAVPIVLLISGSGPTDRDGNSALLPGKNDTLKLLAQALAKRGVASVRYDKRGIAASAAAMKAEKDIRFDTYVYDAADWITLLRRDARFSRVIVAGHSEGALIGTLAAERGGVAAVATLEGAGRPAATVLREQLKPKLPAALYAQADAILTKLQAGRLAGDAIPEALQSLFRPSVQPYLISWFKYDPAVELGKVGVPATIVQGTADVQVTMADAQALHRGDPAAKLVVVDGMNHVLKHAPDTSTMAAILRGYSDPTLPVDPKVIAALTSLSS